MKRREFLVGTGLALGATPLVGCGGGAPPTAAPDAHIPTTWPEVKAEFALAPELAHMAGFFLASHPRMVRDAIDRHRHELDRNPFGYIEDNVARFETGVRAAAAVYMGATVDQLAMTDSTTMGLGLVYGNLVLAPGKEILSTTHDHYVTTMACAQRAQRGGATFRQIALYDDPARADAAAIVGRLTAALRPETRVVAVTWVHSGTGVKLPIRAMADALAAANASRAEADRALLCVDGVHGFGIEDVAIPDLGGDIFVAGCHKWIFGPRGTGLVWGTPAGWAATAPTIPTMDPMWRPGPLESLPKASLMTPGGFHSFEHRWALEAAFRFHLGLGKARVAARIHELNRHMKAELARMSKVRVATPLSDELSAGIACFSVDGMAPAAVVSRLHDQGVIASVTPGFYDPAYVRLAAGLINLEADVERALAAVRAL
jgi:isopenicillin-N epimerase